MQSFASSNVSPDVTVDGTTIKGAVAKQPGSVGTIPTADFYNYLMIEMENVLDDGGETLYDNPTGDDGKSLSRSLVQIVKGLVNPVGTVITHASKQAYNPVGLDDYLRCDGSVKLQAEYPLLFAAIDTSYNTGGEGALEFRLPDLRSMFVRGADFDPNIGPVISGESSTTLTVSNLPDHTHGITDVVSQDANSGSGATLMDYNTGLTAVSGGMTTGGSATSFTNNPQHLQMYYYIKAK